MAKKKFPKMLIALLDDEGTPISFETPEDISDDFADEPIGVYQLIAVGKFSVEKSVNAKPVKKLKVGRSGR